MNVVSFYWCLFNVLSYEFFIWEETYIFIIDFIYVRYQNFCFYLSELQNFSCHLPLFLDKGELMLFLTTTMDFQSLENDWNQSFNQCPLTYCLWKTTQASHCHSSQMLYQIDKWARKNWPLFFCVFLKSCQTVSKSVFHRLCYFNRIREASN